MSESTNGPLCSFGQLARCQAVCYEDGALTSLQFTQVKRSELLLLCYPAIDKGSILKDSLLLTKELHRRFHSLGNELPPGMVHLMDPADTRDPAPARIARHLNCWCLKLPFGRTRCLPARAKERGTASTTAGSFVTNGYSTTLCRKEQAVARDSLNCITTCLDASLRSQLAAAQLASSNALPSRLSSMSYSTFLTGVTCTSPSLLIAPHRYAYNLLDRRVYSLRSCIKVHGHHFL